MAAAYTTKGIVLPDGNTYHFIDQRMGDLGQKDSASGTLTDYVTAASGTVTPAGTVTVTPNTTTKYTASSTTGGGTVTAGKAASCTLPSLSLSVSDNTLTIGWSAGSFTANTPTAVKLPSFASTTVTTGIKSASFSGSSSTVDVTLTTGNKTVTVS